MMKTTMGRWMVVGALVMAAPALARSPATAPDRHAQKAKRAEAQKAQQAFESDAPREVKKAIEERVKKVETAWNAGDFEEMAAAYTEDATLMTPMSKATGKEEIRRTIREDHEGPMRGTQARMEVTSVRTVSPTVAIADVKQTIENGGPGVPSEAHITLVAVKEGNEWKAQAVRSLPVMDPQQMGVGGAGMAECPPAEKGPARDTPLPTE